MWYIYTRNTTSLLPLITVSLFSVFVNLLLFHRYSPGPNTGVGSLSLLQGIFQTQGSNPGLPHCRQILAEPQGKPKNTGVGSLSLLQRIFPSQGSNPGPLHCRWILHQLSKKGRTSANSLKSGVVNQHMRISNTPVGSRLSPQSFKYLILVSV